MYLEKFDKIVNSVKVEDAVEVIKSVDEILWRQGEIARKTHKINTSEITERGWDAVIEDFKEDKIKNREFTFMTTEWKDAAASRDEHKRRIQKEMQKINEIAEKAGVEVFTERECKYAGVGFMSEYSTLDFLLSENVSDAKLFLEENARYAGFEILAERAENIKNNMPEEVLATQRTMQEEAGIKRVNALVVGQIPSTVKREENQFEDVTAALNTVDLNGKVNEVKVFATYDKVRNVYLIKEDTMETIQQDAWPLCDIQSRKQVYGKETNIKADPIGVLRDNGITTIDYENKKIRSLDEMKNNLDDLMRTEMYSRADIDVAISMYCNMQLNRVNVKEETKEKIKDLRGYFGEKYMHLNKVERGEALKEENPAPFSPRRENTENNRGWRTKEREVSINSIDAFDR